MAKKGVPLTEEHKRKIGKSNRISVTNFYKTQKGEIRAKKHSLFMSGRKLSSETKKQMSLSAPKGEDNHAWKGDNVGYQALHAWVERKLGKPQKCSQCGRDNLIGRKIQWANVSGNYRRDIGDWIRLCAKCHVIKDGTINNLIYFHENISR